MILPLPPPLQLNRNAFGFVGYEVETKTWNLISELRYVSQLSLIIKIHRCSQKDIHVFRYLFPKNNLFEGLDTRKTSTRRYDGRHWK